MLRPYGTLYVGFTRKWFDKVFPGRSASRPRVRAAPTPPRSPAEEKRGDTPFTQRRTDVGMVYNGARSQVCVGRARGSLGAIV